MKIFYQILPFMLALVLFSCGGGDRESETTESDLDETEEVEDAPIEASFDELLKGDIEEYKTVVFECFVGDLPSTMYFGEGELTLDFYPRRNQSEGKKMRVDIPTGTSNNRVEDLPETYYQEDLKIHTDNGDIAVAGDYVRITGTYSEASDDMYQYIDAEKIELLDYSFDESVFETAPELTDDLMTDETQDKAYAYVEGNA